MSETVADIVLQRLREWGVRQVFGYPGDGINGLLSAWVRAEDDPQFVQSRHELVGQGAADAGQDLAGVGVRRGHWGASFQQGMGSRVPDRVRQRMRYPAASRTSDQSLCPSVAHSWKFSSLYQPSHERS